VEKLNEVLKIRYKNQNLSISYFLRSKKKLTLVYLHGLGCSKDDFASILQMSKFNEYNLMAFDFPGHGNSTHPKKYPLRIDDLVRITKIVLSKLKLNNLILIGHSMGGLVALLYIEMYPKKVKGFINVEGNLTPEDCFFSRKAEGYSVKQFITKRYWDIKNNVKKRKNKGFQKYVGHLNKTNPKSYYDYCSTITLYSDYGNLIPRFLKIGVPKIFMYGSENKNLSYLSHLKQKSCKLIEVPNSNHWAVYDNPRYYYKSLCRFVRNIK
jgi:pimeloyl-ACP methyl ester carboxylesterase